MKEEFYEAGQEDAVLDCFQKEAVVPLGAALGQGWKHLAGRIAPLFGAQVGKGVAEGAAARAAKPGLLGRAATGTENAISGGVRKVLGDRAGDFTQKAVQGVPREMFSQAAGGAALMGGLEGTIGAATAAPGERLEAFGKGLGHGAASGAAFGGVGGLGGGLIRNARKGVATSAARRAGYDQLPGYSAQGAAEQQMQRGFFKNLKDIKTQQGPIGRGASALDAAGRVGQMGAEWVLPGVVLPASLMSMSSDMPAAQDQTGEQVRQMAENPNQPLTQQEQEVLRHYLAHGAGHLRKAAGASPDEPLINPVYGGAVAGSLPAGITAGYLVRHLASKGKIPNTPPGLLAQTAIPALAAATGGIGGSMAAKKIWPPPPPDPAVEKLHDIDFDKLMRYYKKKPGE